MDIRNKYFLYGLISFTAMTLICIIFYLIRGDTLGLSYTTELRVESNGITSEIKISSKDMCKYHFENGVLIKRMTSIPRSYATPIMELPEAVESFDIENKQEPISEITWQSDLQSSANYIEYLKLSGYEDVLSIYSPDNIELFLDKGTVRKRVVVFKESIMIGEVLKEYSLPDVTAYFK